MNEPSKLFEDRSVRGFIYRNFGVGAPIWKTTGGKIFLRLSTGFLLVTCITILVICAYFVFMGFLYSEPDYENRGEACLPYGDCY